MDPKEEMEKLTAQFQEMWKNFGGTTPDWGKFADMSEGPADFWKSVMQSNKNNLDALVEVNKSVADSVKTIGERQVNLFETMMDEADKATKAMQTSGKVDPDAAGAAFQKMINGMREIAEIAEKANRDALTEIEKRVTAFQAEMKDSIAKTDKG